MESQQPRQHTINILSILLIILVAERNGLGPGLAGLKPGRCLGQTGVDAGILPPVLTARFSDTVFASSTVPSPPAPPPDMHERCFSAYPPQRGLETSEKDK